MCGRFSLTSTPRQIRDHFGYAEEPEFPPRALVAPTEPVALVLQQGGRRHFGLMRWGFLPKWVKDASTFPLIFNVRGETAADKPAFRNAVRRRRCLFPADAWFERPRSATPRGRRGPAVRISRRDGAPIGLAGIWETHLGPDGAELDTAAILTIHANGTLSALGERMPVVIERADFEAWLDPARDDPTRAMALVRPAGDDVLVLEAGQPVASSASPKPDDAQLRLL